MRRNLIAAIGILALVGSFLVQSSGPAAAQSIIAQAARGTLSAPVIHTGNGTRRAPMISAGTIVSAQDDMRAEEADASSGAAPMSGPANGTPQTLGCSERDRGRDVRVNQDCTYRRQAEETITFNPTDPNNLLAGQNDSRVGYNQTGIDWSLDNGNHWGDMLPPFRQKLNNPAAERPTAADPNSHTVGGNNGTIHSYDAASDPILAVDSRGRFFYGAVAFDVASNASLLFVTRSEPAAKGSFFYNIGTDSPFTRRYIVDEDNSAEIFNDKPFLVADKYASSKNRDNVYVTWTLFRYSTQCGQQPAPPAPPVEQYCASPIFGSMSTDHGVHWSTPEEISGSATALCFFGNLFNPALGPNACNFDQGSDPTVLPNGDLEVIFNNGNTAKDNPNAQQLSVHCKPSGSSTAGTAHLNCGSPALVGKDVVVGEPLCNFGRGPEECVPGPWIRTNDFPRINKNVHANNHLYATWQDYRNHEYDIQLSESTDGGLTWHEVGTVNPDRGTDHYMPAVELNPNKDVDVRTAAAPKDTDDVDHVGDSYYRSNRVPNENTLPAQGFFAPCPQPSGSKTTCQSGVQNEESDYDLAGGRANRTPYVFKVVSPEFAPPDGIQAGFNGDYSGLTINRNNEAHPIWSDTRNINPFPENAVVHDEDVFTVNTGLPDGQGKVGPGQVTQPS